MAAQLAEHSRVHRSVAAGWDSLMVMLAVAQGILLLLVPSVPFIALGLWWNSNTISHNFIHRPFFRVRALNRIFSCYLTLLLGFPQSFWRARHLAHHAAADRATRGGKTHHSFPVEGTGISHLLGGGALDLSAASVLWLSMFVFARDFALTVYLPGFVIGLGFCFLQGHYEHARGTVSHYGGLYNLVFFNDGYHVEHHQRPGEHWRSLPSRSANRSSSSRWPAVLRWLECLDLCALERVVLHAPLLQRFVVNRHLRAFRLLLPDANSIKSAAIVGGGLFPRTAIILNRLLPGARLTLIDMNDSHLDIARRFLDGHLDSINERFDPAVRCPYDLITIPLAYVGDREAFYVYPPARSVLVHDWIWRPRGKSVVVSWLLMKRLNLVTQ
jgi:hypothetical protein